MIVKELQFGIKQYSYSQDFSDDDKNQLISYLNQKYFDSDNYEKNLPGFQTTSKINLLDNTDIPQFKKLKDSFISSCSDYINEEKLAKKLEQGNYNIYCWVYMNYLNSGRNGQRYHTHNTINPYTISAVLYLHLPDKLLDNRTETVFCLGCNKVYLPSVEYNWFLYPSSFGHYPGDVISKNRRYTIAADIWFDCDDIPY